MTEKRDESSLELFYSRDEESRFETHGTEAEARRCAEEILDTCQEEASDNGWPEGTGDIEWGRLIPLGECVASNERESDRSDFDYLIDYSLKDLPDPTTALRSSLASVARERDAAVRRVAEALDVIEKFGSIDGDHHKTWVIDQAVRALTGDGYAQWVKEQCDGEDGPNTYDWDEGIPP